jgi:hypothetical protein
MESGMAAQATEVAKTRHNRVRSLIAEVEVRTGKIAIPGGIDKRTYSALKLLTGLRFAASRRR